MRAVWIVSLVIVGSIAALAAFGSDNGTKPSAADPYPLSTELAVLERDLTSGDYRAVLATMIPTDLAAEWQRVATVDNYLLFAEAHGGREKILADPTLKSAYGRRRQVADRFLSLIREVYAKRRLKAPFDNAGKLEAALKSATQTAGKKIAASQLAVRTLMPIEGADRQWPRLRGPDGQGTAVDTEMPLRWSASENVVWKTAVPGRGNSSPVVWGDRIFITSATPNGNERKIVCYARSDGRLLWEHAAPPATGKEWLYSKNTFASSTPVTDGQRVIAFLGSSGLLCVDFEGHRQWHVELGLFPTMHGPGTSALLYKDKVICIQYQNRGKTLFAAFDKKTGAKRWQHERPNAMCWSTPVILRVGDHDELVYNGSSSLAGYDPETGNERWHAAGTSEESIPTAVVGGGLIYSLSGRNGPMMAVRPGGNGDVTDTHIVWRKLRGGPHVPSPLYHEGRLYIVNDTGIVTCLDAADGRTVWQNRLPGRFSMSPVEAIGRILVTSEDGRSTIFKAGDKFEVLAENELGETVLATPALLAGQLYFRSAGHLWCIGQTKASATPANDRR